MSPTTETLDSIHEVLEPLQALQTENAELGGWIHDSFSALEKLHEELTQWQSELSRKETDLDLREEAVSKGKASESDLQQKLTQLELELATARDELQQLEEVSSEELQELEELENRLAELDAELNVSRARIIELEAKLLAEREHSSAAQDTWKGEFRELHEVLDKYYTLLSEQMSKVLPTNSEPPLCPAEKLTPTSSAPRAKSAELRERVQSRREAKRNSGPTNS